MKFEGVLTKMQTENGAPIQYFLVFENDFLNVNQLLDKKIVIGTAKYTDKAIATIVFMKYLR